MGRKRKRDRTATGSPPQNPFASPRSAAQPPVPRSPVSRFTGQNLLALAGACAGLLLITFLAFRPALDKDAGFVNLDDNRYVYDNEHVKQGLTGDSIAWAFTSLEYDNWHPLTWLSHMLDRTIFGPKSLEHPRGYHLVNVLIHAINVLVLFLLLIRMTSAPWPSLLVAILFGIHPLRAESVAWISERKDVLSGFFFLLTIWAYAGYARRRSWVRYFLYCLAIVIFAAGLMAKPMLVTLPVLLLLLDYWPLVRLGAGQAGSREQGAGSGEHGARQKKLVRFGAPFGRLSAPDSLLPVPCSPLALLLEKIPFAVLAVASSIVTVIAQRGAMLVIDTITLPMRLENALVSYAAYVGEIFFPVRLAPLYPFPEHGVPVLSIAVSALALATITAVVAWMRKWRWLTVGWLWYLVAVTPVIGLMQVGVQAMADRYTYLPQVGLYVMLAWSLEALSAALPFRRWVWSAGLAALVPILILATSAQTSIWKNSETLWTGALKANPNIALAENNLGYVDQSNGRMDQAFERYKHAVEIRPRYVEAHINLGNMYMVKNQIDEAVKHYRTAIEIRPDYILGYVNLGAALTVRGDLPGAEEALRKALQLDAHDLDANRKMGNLLIRRQKYEEAIPCYAFLAQLPPTAGEATATLGYLYYVTHQPQKALECWTNSLESQPDSLPVLTMTAWLLATDPDRAVRDGNRAVALAERAIRVSGGRDARVLAALAAGYAETGDFVLAAQTVEQAIRLQGAATKDPKMLKLLQYYQSRRPFYDREAIVIMPAAATQ
jgi:protein O-mannosyl-transferase